VSRTPIATPLAYTIPMPTLPTSRLIPKIDNTPIVWTRNPLTLSSAPQWTAIVEVGSDTDFVGFRAEASTNPLTTDQWTWSLNDNLSSLTPVARSVYVSHDIEFESNARE
jgi:hypothetical protein